LKVPSAQIFSTGDPALLVRVERVLLSGTPAALCQFDVLNPVSTLIPSCLISNSFLKQNGVPKSVEDRQTLQIASATERSIDAAGIKLLNPRISLSKNSPSNNSLNSSIQKFFKLFKDPQILHQTLSLRVSKTLSAAQTSMDSRPRTCLSTREGQKATNERRPTVRTFCVPRNLLMKDGEEDGSTPA
jgi:hypothetical protein